MGNGGEFELSQEVLAVLPSDPYEQLDVARRITAMAISTRMSKLESETGKLRQRLAEKEHVILGLQERVAEAQSTLQETNSKITQSMDEQAKLATEKNSLALQVKKLMRDVAKLETFKRTLMQSLQEEDDKHGGEGGNNRGEPQSLALYKATQAETLSKAQIFEDDGRYARASFSANPPQYHDDADSKSATPTSQSARNSPKQIIRGTSSARGTPSLTPRLTPTGSPKPQPKKGSPLPSSYTLDSQHIQIPTSQPTSRSSSPPSSGSGQSRTTRLDGKEFFRQARARLSYEQFSSFLANIKELNAHRQTREVKLSVYTLSDPLLKSIRHLMWLIYVDKSSWCSYEKLLRAARTYLCGVLYDTASESICCTHCRRLWRMLRISLAQRTGTCMLHSKEF
uniref:At4g15545-like C-terminal domain-containing protein n=1 Tax=Physcomitrium patens TaxID=3218 RepID=A0A2K1JHT6_PHYPA|nr:hypothetical protein PHYPA_018523 [Physcomitrium patens]